MNPTIKDLEGKTIEVTDIPKAIEEAETYVYFSEADNNEALLKHWSHILAELKKLKPNKIEPIKSCSTCNYKDKSNRYFNSDICNKFNGYCVSIRNSWCSDYKYWELISNKTQKDLDN